jgi:hypothetical protein
MLKKTITFTDFNGNERTEDFYFNLTTAELVEMEMSTSGGFAEMVHEIVATQRVPEIIKVFKDMIAKAYGVKSPDGRQFIKTKENWDSFASTEAYSVLFTELAFNTDAASNFVNGLIPAGMNKLPIKPEIVQ